MEETTINSHSSREVVNRQRSMAIAGSELSLVCNLKRFDLAHSVK